MLSESIGQRFRLTKYQTVKDWKTETKCPLSLELLTAVINRGREPSIPAVITMLYLLDCPPGEIAEICKQAGDTIFHRLITPQTMSSEEKEIVESIRSLDDAKKRLVLTLIDQLKG